MAKDKIPGSQGEKAPMLDRGFINSSALFPIKNYIERGGNVNTFMHLALSKQVFLRYPKGWRLIIG